MEENSSVYLLQTTPGIGRKTIQKLLEKFQSAHQIVMLSDDDIQNSMTDKQIQSLKRHREECDPCRELDLFKKRGIDYYSIMDEKYPQRLRKIPDPPIGLFVMGSLPDEKQSSAAVVGTRKYSYYGEKMTRIYTQILARHHISIISGMARGIDSIAHKCALEEGDMTYAVLGCGVDVCYPPENEILYRKILKQGGLISEYLPGTMPAAGLFPERNRIISGLSDFLLIMEARERSGTLITADMALEQGKDIYALPGRVDDALSYGCNRLIAQGAYILPPPEEFLQDPDCRGIPEDTKSSKMQEKTGQKKTEKCVLKQKNESIRLSKTEEILLSFIDYQPVELGVILRNMQHKTGMDEQDAMRCLMDLCIKKAVVRERGTFFRKR